MNFDKEKKNERAGLFISLSIHGILLLLFFFLLAWKEPFPPIPEYGIELNFGLDNSGSGNIQQENTEPSPINQEESQPQEEAIESEQLEPTEETIVEEVPEESIIEKSVEDIIETVESPDVRVNKNEDTPPVVEEIIESQEAVQNSPVIEESVTEVTTPAGNNQGDDIQEVGDEGDPSGEIDERALYGNPGAGSGGASLDMAGWMWDQLPRPNDKSDEVGRIVFEIKVDADGYITSITRIQSTVSPAVESIYRSEIEQLTFHKIGTANAPRRSSGRITFIIKSN
ncbi:MAG: hypothetical protein O2887_12995 [Bacteroidetes bacterium]|nr:hypothetical protein [Bacteroidota bacterium]MDA1121386.1 hypothetical protein [Bacteroidota bacterium]